MTALRGMKVRTASSLLAVISALLYMAFYFFVPICRSLMTSRHITGSSLLLNHDGYYSDRPGTNNGAVSQTEATAAACYIDSRKISKGYENGSHFGFTKKFLNDIILTKTNVRAGMGVHIDRLSDGGGRTYKISPELYNILSDMTPFQSDTLVNCLVIGTDGEPKNSKFGNCSLEDGQIDLTLKCSIDNYADTGLPSKVTLSLLNSSDLRKYRFSDTGGGKIHALIEATVNDDFLWLPIFDFIQGKGDFSLIDKVVRSFSTHRQNIPQEIIVPFGMDVIAKGTPRTLSMQCGVAMATAYPSTSLPRKCAEMSTSRGSKVAE
ncbi:uncharacterized protein [Ptychodera flava]|uniref:uncharacterized protein n=1 Tax=Ptychodera flava TaxID=63121 RepID=UPI00396A0038